MSPLSMWAAIVAIGLLTFTYRWSFVILFERLTVPPWLQRMLRFVPIAALTAIITPELLIQQGALNLSALNTRLIAGAIASLVAYKTRNVLVTIVVGMLVLWLLNALVAAVF
jgi:branched-subunit amino acid transport protein